jgi:hypothetical protein
LEHLISFSSSLHRISENSAQGKKQTNKGRKKDGYKKGREIIVQSTKERLKGRSSNEGNAN